MGQTVSIGSPGDCMTPRSYLIATNIGHGAVPDHFLALGQELKRRGNGVAGACLAQPAARDVAGCPVPDEYCLAAQAGLRGRQLWGREPVRTRALVQARAGANRLVSHPQQTD